MKSLQQQLQESYLEMKGILSENQDEELSLEEALELYELSKKTLGSYIKKASEDGIEAGYSAGKGGDGGKGITKAGRRLKGITKATNRLTKEEFDEDLDEELSLEEALELHELSKKTLGSYIKKAVVDRDRLQHRSDASTFKGEHSYSDRSAKLHFADAEKSKKKAGNRLGGIVKATDRLTREQVEVLESIAEELDEEVLNESYAKKYASAPDHVKRVADEMKRLKKLDKATLIRTFPSRLQTGHLKSEPKDVIIGGHLETKFSRKHLQDHDKHFFG